jgi:ssDNA-binding Zn-finger/Zn-ribbon topoisomerase 1
MKQTLKPLYKDLRLNKIEAALPKRYCMDCGTELRIVQKPTYNLIGCDDSERPVYTVNCMMRCPKKKIFSSKHRDIRLLWCESWKKWVVKI